MKNMRFVYGSFSFAVILFLIFSGCSSQKIKDDPSESAYAAGQSALVLGGCHAPFSIGFEVCNFEEGATLPIVQILFTNPAEFAVSDCDGGIYVTGATDHEAIVPIDLSKLSTAFNARGFCFIKIESVESYFDKTDQEHLINERGWVILEAFKAGYLPHSLPQESSFCYKVSRTIKGRTTLVKTNCN